MSKLPRVDIVNVNFLDPEGAGVVTGGAERYVVELARLIDTLGGRTRIVQNASRPFSAEYGGVPVAGVVAGDSADMAAMSAGFAEEVRGAALVIASPVDLAAKLSTAAPVIGINHGIYWDYPNNRIDLHDPAIERRMVDAVLACRACVSVDTNFPNWLRCFDADATARLRYIPNFVDLGRFHSTAKTFDGPRLEVLFPRRLCRERGFRDVVTAFDFLLPRNPLLELHLCGSGPDDDEEIACAFVARHPQQARWSTLGMDAMPAAYASSHIVLVPTVFAEGTSLSCIEAMATNNALVVTAVGGLPNLVVDGYNGIVVPPGADGLVGAIERLLDDRELTERLARNALTVAPAFARERWLARWTELLVETLPALSSEAADADGPKVVATDPYEPIDWPYGLEAEREQLYIERDAARDESSAHAREALEAREAQAVADRRRLQVEGECEALRAERDAAQGEAAGHALDASEARSAQTFAEQQLYWRDAELDGIRNSTGWAVLQFMYRFRFALFPRGSRSEAAAKWLLNRARAYQRQRRQIDSAHSPPAPPETHAEVDIPARVVATATPCTIVCLPSIEWSFRFQRPQQLARVWASDGHDVIFAKHSFGRELTSRRVESRIDEIELPGVAGTNPYRDALGSADAQRMADALLAYLAGRGCGRFVCLVQLPFWAGVARRMREVSGCDVVYDCMDLHTGFSSNAGEALAEEERLLADADLVVCASQILADHAAPHAKRMALVRNGADVEHFARVASRRRGAGDARTIGYYGAIADWFDSGLVAEIAQLRPAWRFVLIGSTWSADTAPLEAAPNIVLLGEKPYAELPDLIAGWDCCVIPFRHTPLTAATNPVKVYEMLAAGKPVVSVGLPELASMGEAGLVALAEGPAAFVAAIEAQTDGDGEERRAERREFAQRNTWQIRARQVLQALDDACPHVSIVVVTYNNRDLNELCLRSIFQDTDYPDVEVIAVDNGSSDGTPEFLREFALREKRLRVILNSDNRGFAAANNQGAAIAHGSYLCFLNNDTVVHGSWLRTLIVHLRRNARLGLVGPVTNAIGNEAKIPVGYRNLADMPGWADAHCAANRGRVTDASMLAFFCVALPRWVWHVVGPLDERFGTGMFEDDDYNRRVRAAGFEVGLAWDSFVHHWQMASFKLLGNEEYLRIYRENELLYAKKWADAAGGPTPMPPLERRAAAARGTVIFAPSVGWAIDLAQRPHHLARVLARDGYLVVFDVSNAADPVDTLREVENGLFLFKGPPAALAGLARTTLWTFSYNYDYRDHFPSGTAVIYDWIDDLSVFPYDQRKLASLHARALREADVVISVARRLHERAVESRPDALYMPNAVEELLFDREPEPNPALADPEFGKALAAGRPIAGYYGALARWFDYALVAATARLRPDWTFVLIGPDHDGSLARSKLARLPNVHCLGPRPYPSLPGYLHRFDVATIPFLINEITLATSPLKLYEYFAAGRPVVSTALPECATFAEVRIAVSAEEFSSALDAARIEGGEATFRERLVALAAENTWRARARVIMARLEAASASDRAPLASLVRVEATASPAAMSIMKRFAALESPANRHYFRALAAHLAGSHDDPCLPMYFEFALSANERGRKVAAMIDSLVPLAGKRALDVGCAYGGFVVALGERGADPTGFDIDDTLLALGEHNFRDVGRRYPIRHADVTKAEDVSGFEDAFDVITCNDVIEHVDDPAIALRHIAAMLRHGGVAYFEIPNRDDVDAVRSDGHYQLFGITQLEHQAARRYYAAHAPASRYGVGHYLRLDEYRALFEGAGLSMELLRDTVAAPVESVLARVAALRKDLTALVDAVPAEIRGEVRDAVARYLDEAESAPRTSAGARRQFLQRYGQGFWRIIARKRGAAPAERPVPPALAHKRQLRGTCNVCGMATRFFGDEPALDRESLTCEHCLTTSRYRSIARGVLKAIHARTGVRADAIARLPGNANGIRYAVYDTQPSFRFETCAYPIPDLLRQRRWMDVTVSSYRSDVAPGSLLGDRVVNENLERLTFADASFDLVITSDVMEHVRLDGRAHAEIARALKPGGAYVFTVPHFRDRRETFVRVRVHDPDDPSRDEHLTAPEYHGDANAPGGQGALSYRSYGTELDETLAALGFDVEYSFADDDVHGIRNTELFYCIKRGGAA